MGAKVNGQIVPLRHPLANGDVVEILTQKGHGPSRDWLSFVRTSHARSKIRQWINLNERHQATEVGRKLMEREARQFGVSLKKISEEDLLRVATEYGRAKVEDLYADLGYGKYSARQVFAKLTGPRRSRRRSDKGANRASRGSFPRSSACSASAIRPFWFVGQDDLMVFRAKCCNPIPGDPIVGYVTRGRGVAVHTTACPNVQNLMYQSERRIAVQWSEAGRRDLPRNPGDSAKDRPGMLAEMTTFISATGANIRSLESRPENLQARIDATIEIADRNQLERILKNIKRISGIFDVERVYRV